MVSFILGISNEIGVDIMYNVLTLFGDQSILLKIKHEDRITSYGVFVGIRLLSGITLEKEFRFYLSSLKTLLEERKETFLTLLEKDDESVLDALRNLAHEANDILDEEHRTRLEVRQIGFCTNKFSEEEFENYSEEKERIFTQTLSIAI